MREAERRKSDFMFDRREFESTPLKLSAEPNVKSLRASFFGYFNKTASPSSDERIFYSFYLNPLFHSMKVRSYCIHLLVKEE
jgi:hypothetical protein